MELKKLDMFTDYVAIIPAVVQTALSLPTEVAQSQNEGFVVGFGPQAVGLALGDKVFMRGRGALVIDTENGFYKGKRLLVLKYADIILKLPVADDEKPTFNEI